MMKPRGRRPVDRKIDRAAFRLLIGTDIRQLGQGPHRGQKPGRPGIEFGEIGIRRTVYWY